MSASAASLDGNRPSDDAATGGEGVSRIAAHEKPRLAGIEGIRGVASSGVVIYHVARHVHQAHDISAIKATTQFGHVGVDLFFVISGFVILFVHGEDVGRPSRVMRYFVRRATRLLPVYWIALGVAVMISFAAQSSLPAVHRLLWSALLIPSFQEPVLGVAWTLQHEILFYTIFAILILDRAAGAVVMAFWLMLMAASGAGVTMLPPWVPPSAFSMYNLEFFFGMAAAALLRLPALNRDRLALWSGSVTLLAAATAEDLGGLDGYAAYARLVYGLSCGLLVLGIAGMDRRGLLATPSWLQSLGQASYSIYLFQFAFIGCAWRIWVWSGLDGLAPAWCGFVVLVAAALAGGVLVSRLVEQPLLGLMRGRSRVSAAVDPPLPS